MTKVEQICRRLKESILNGELLPGDVVTPERELAGQLLCSRVSVRGAYGLLSEEGILEKFPGRGGSKITAKYRGHRIKNNSIAVLATLQDHFAREFLESVQYHCLKNNMLAVLAVTPEDTTIQETLAKEMWHNNVRNFLVWGMNLSLNQALFSRLRILGCNLVFFDRVRPREGFADYIALDQEDAVNKIFQKILEEKIGKIVGVTAGNLAVDSNLDRKKAMSSLALQHKIQCSWYELDWKNSQKDSCNLPPFPGEETAFFTVNDDLALRVRNFYGRKARIFSIDGTEEARNNGIVSCRQDLNMLAGLAVEKLLLQQSLGNKWRAGEYFIKGSVE